MKFEGPALVIFGLKQFAAARSRKRGCGPAHRGLPGLQYRSRPDHRELVKGNREISRSVSHITGAQ